MQEENIKIIHNKKEKRKKHKKECREIQFKVCDRTSEDEDEAVRWTKE
jgi:hypothetical protein